MSKTKPESHAFQGFVRDPQALVTRDPSPRRASLHGAVVEQVTIVLRVRTSAHAAEDVFLWGDATDTHSPIKTGDRLMLSGSIYERTGHSRRPARLREFFVESVSLARPRLTSALFRRLGKFASRLRIRLGGDA